MYDSGRPTNTSYEVFVIVFKTCALYRKIKFISFIDCSTDPFNMGNGTYVTSWGNYYSSVATYTCNPGWYIDGPSTKQCWDYTTYGVGEWPAPPGCFGIFYIHLRCITFKVRFIHTYHICVALLVLVKATPSAGVNSTVIYIYRVVF